MITTRTLGQQTLDRLKKFTSDSDITENDCIIAVQQVLADVAEKKRLQDIQTDGFHSYDGSLYYTFFDQPVLDSEHGKYFNLPAAISSAPHGQGIRVMKNLKSESYVPLPAGFNSLTAGLKVNQLGGRMGFYVLGDKGYFAENTLGLEPPSQVVIQMLTPVMDANVEAYMMIPSNLQNIVINMALQTLVPTLEIQADETKDDIDQPV